MPWPGLRQALRDREAGGSPAWGHARLLSEGAAVHARKGERPAQDNECQQQQTREGRDVAVHAVLAAPPRTCPVVDAGGDSVEQHSGRKRQRERGRRGDACRAPAGVMGEERSPAAQGTRGPGDGGCSRPAPSLGSDKCHQDLRGARGDTV